MSREATIEEVQAAVEASQQMSPYEAWARTQFTRGNRVFNAAKQHMPKWLVAAIPIALMIPGPQDEIVVLGIIAIWAAFKPDMRRDMMAAWRVYA